MRRYSRCTTPIGVGIYVCSRFRWWHSLRSFTIGYRNNTPVGVSLVSPHWFIHNEKESALSQTPSLCNVVAIIVGIAWCVCGRGGVSRGSSRSVAMMRRALRQGMSRCVSTFLPSCRRALSISTLSFWWLHRHQHMVALR